MRWNKTVTMVEAHGEGEAGRVIVGGVLDVPGQTMIDKMNHINRVDDTLRRFCVMEPRGCAQMSTNLLLPATRADADAGLIILQGDKAHGMSGSNCICVVTVMLETGMIEMKEPQTVIRLDTPVGLVTATASCADGKCERVTLDMVPSFVEELDREVEVDGIGRVRCDIAFGGVYYALLDPAQIGLSIVPAAARALVNAGCSIQRALKRTVKVQHPEIPSLNSISYTMFIEHNSAGEQIGAAVLPPGRIDRSPCGTGSSARLAVRYARGEVQPGARCVARSIINSEVEMEFIGETTVGGRQAVLPRVSGRGWIYGFHRIGRDPSDPYPLGYMLSDTWGEGFDLMS